MLRILMDSMHTAGLALVVQGFSTGLLGKLQLLSMNSSTAACISQAAAQRMLHAGVANFLTGNHGGAASMGYNGFSKAFTAAVIFRASAAFDRAVTSTSCNVASMLSAIGGEGLTKL
jgi:poly(3-hydroxybutyrate) depolymerase